MRGPNVVAITACVVRQERKDIAAFSRKVIDRSDKTFALAVFPIGISGLPITNVCSPLFKGAFSGFFAMVLSKSANAKFPEHRLPP